jgi:hypothetical protein
VLAGGIPYDMNAQINSPMRDRAGIPIKPLDES